MNAGDAGAGQKNGCLTILTLLMLFELFILKDIDNFQNNYEYLGRRRRLGRCGARRAAQSGVLTKTLPGRQDLDLLANDGGGLLGARKHVCCYPLLLRWPLAFKFCCPSCCVLRLVPHYRQPRLSLCVPRSRSCAPHGGGKLAWGRR